MNNRESIDFEKWGIKPVEQSTINDQSIDFQKWGIKPVSKNNNLDPNIMNRIPGAAKQVAKDVGGLISGIPKSIVKGVGNIPSGIEFLKREVPLSAKQIYNDPQRAARNAAAGTIEMGGDISRIPGMLPDYLAHIGMISPETAKGYVRPPSEQSVHQFANKIAGEGQKPGDVAIRGGFRNIPSIYGLSKVVKTLNPMQLTAKNIAKDVIKAKEAAQSAYSGEKGLYTKLFNDARKQGLGNVNLDTSKINIADIKSHANPKFTKQLDKLLLNPDIEVAQKAQSDLGKYIKEMNKKASMTSTEQASLKAAEEAQSHIKERMFHENNELKEKYSKITKGYGQDVIPYSTNKAIKEFQAGEITKDQLVDRLSKKPKITKKHKAISLREIAKSLSASKIGQGGLIGTGAALGYAGGQSILNKLLGNKRKE